jgi:hypothetical protein
MFEAWVDGVRSAGSSRGYQDSEQASDSNHGEQLMFRTSFSWCWWMLGC